MIIKFDHLSYSCSYEEEEKTINMFCSNGEGGGHILQFRERIKSPLIKNQIMQNACDMHGLVMLQPIDQNHFRSSVPIEITSYPKVFGSPSYDLLEGLIEFRTRKIEDSLSFYQQLGFEKETRNVLSLKTMLDKKRIYVKLVESSDYYSHCLDVKGFSSMAWIVNKIEKYTNKLKGQGITVTDISEVIVNKRRLKICFVIGKQGEIIELIGAD